MKQRERQLPPPPRMKPRGEFPAIIEPALRDIPEAIDEDIDGSFELVASERQDNEEDEAVLEVARKTALADERVRKALGERYSLIGVSRRADDKEQREPRLLLVGYRYGDGRAIEVWLSGEGRALRVEEVLEADYHPPPSDEEVERVIALARTARGVAMHLRDGDEATAILTSDVDPGDRHFGRRRFVVGFGPANERRPRIQALVDLGSERVLGIDTSGREDDEEQGS